MASSRARYRSLFDMRNTGRTPEIASPGEPTPLKDTASYMSTAYKIATAKDKVVQAKLNKSGLLSDEFSSKYYDEILMDSDTEKLFTYTHSRMDDVGLLGYIEDLLQPLQSRIKPTEKGLMNVALNLDKMAGTDGMELVKKAKELKIPVSDYLNNILSDDTHDSYNAVIDLMGQAERNVYGQLIDGGYSPEKAAQIMDRSPQDIGIVPNINPFGLLGGEDTPDPVKYSSDITSIGGVPKPKGGFIENFKSNFKETMTRYNVERGSVQPEYDAFYLAKGDFRRELKVVRKQIKKGNNTNKTWYDNYKTYLKIREMILVIHMVISLKS